jgi:hypothetical protein
MKLDPTFQMSQDKNILIAFWIPIIMEIPSCKYWILTWPGTLQSKGLIRYTDGFRITARLERHLWGEIKEEVIVLLGVHVTAF